MNDTSPSGTDRWLGAALILSPLFGLAASVVAPALHSDVAPQMATIADHPDRWYWYSMLLAANLILMVPAVLGLRVLLRETSPRLSAVGTTLAGLGAVVGLCNIPLQLAYREMATSGAGASVVNPLADRIENSSGAAALFAPGGLAFVVGTVVLTIALVRSRVVAPLWVTAAYVLGAVGQLVGFSAASVVTITVSFALSLVAGGYLGSQLAIGPERVVARPAVAVA
jgi:hypothetical protein